MELKREKTLNIRTLAISAISTFFLFASMPSIAQLTANQEQAKKEGITLYNQYKPAEAQLSVAAEAGDREAQFYLASAIKNDKQYMTPEAFKWYEASAEQGDYYAMLQLSQSDEDLCTAMKNCKAGATSSDEWFTKLIHTAKPNAENGDAEAMTVLYEATGKIEWLEKASNAGYPQAQYKLANLYRDGAGMFIIPGSRNKAVLQLLKSAAESGYPKAMMYYFGELRGQNSLIEARHWLEVAADTGYEPAVYNYGYFLAIDPGAIGLREDLIKGHALISTLKILDGGGDVQNYVNQALPQIEAKMTKDQLDQALNFAMKWKSSHPPLSFFPDKIGD